MTDVPATVCTDSASDKKHHETIGSHPRCFYCNKLIKLMFNVGEITWNPEWIALHVVKEWP